MNLLAWEAVSIEIEEKSIISETAKGKITH